MRSYMKFAHHRREISKKSGWRFLYVRSETESIVSGEDGRTHYLLRFFVAAWLFRASLPWMRGALYLPQIHSKNKFTPNSKSQEIPDWINTQILDQRLPHKSPKFVKKDCERLPQDYETERKAEGKKSWRFFSVPSFFGFALSILKCFLRITDLISASVA